MNPLERRLEYPLGDGLPTPGATLEVAPGEVLVDGVWQPLSAQTHFHDIKSGFPEAVP